MAASVVALLGMGLGNVVLPVLVKAWFPHRIATVTSMYVMGVTAGTSLPALLAVPVADEVAHSTGSERLGWQVGLSWWASLSLLVILAWLGPARHPRATPAPRPVSLIRDHSVADDHDEGTQVALGEPDGDRDHAALRRQLADELRDVRLAADAPHRGRHGAGDRRAHARGLRRDGCARRARRPAPGRPVPADRRCSPTQFAVCFAIG